MTTNKNNEEDEEPKERITDNIFTKLLMGPFLYSKYRKFANKPIGHITIAILLTILTGILILPGLLLMINLNIFGLIWFVFVEALYIMNVYKHLPFLLPIQKTKKLQETTITENRNKKPLYNEIAYGIKVEHNSKE